MYKYGFLTYQFGLKKLPQICVRMHCRPRNDGTRIVQSVKRIWDPEMVLKILHVV